MFVEHVNPAPRRAVRTPFPVEVLRLGAGARFLGYGANVSETGVFVQSSNPRPVGTQLSIQLHLPVRTDTGGPVVVAGEASVVWARGHGPRRRGPPGMGIRFCTIGVADLISLREFCEDLELDVDGGLRVRGAGSGEPPSWVDDLRLWVQQRGAAASKRLATVTASLRAPGAGA